MASIPELLRSLHFLAAANGGNVKKHNTKSLLIILALLLASGCTPGAIGPTDPAAEIVSISATPTEVVEPTPNSSAPPVPTTTPYPTTPTPDPALPPWTPEPSPTPTVTVTPTATPPPLTGPVWRIQFRGMACPNPPDRPGDCSKYSSDLTFTPSVDYLINSDGSSFVTVSEAGIFLVNYSYFELFPNLFSPNGSYIAFATSNCVYVSDLTGNNSVCLVSEGFPAGYRFSLDNSCLTTYFRVLESESAVAKVRLQRNCLNTEETENIGVFEFHELPARPVIYDLSPQGDVLLAHGRMRDGELRLYVQEIGQPAPPRLLFTYPNEDLSGRIVAIRWLPDGSAIDFLLRNQSDNTFYRVSRVNGDITKGISLPEQLQAELGDWSPDGNQFSFSHVEEDGTKSGLYIIDLQTGEWRQILSKFHINWRVRTWIIPQP